MGPRPGFRRDRRQEGRARPRRRVGHLGRRRQGDRGRRARRLAFSFDDPQRADDPTFEPSIVTFEIGPHRENVKLTLTEAHLQSIEELHAVRQGWPVVLANLKTLLETGAVPPQAPWEYHADERAARMAKNG